MPTLFSICAQQRRRGGAFDADALDYFSRVEALGGSFDLSSLDPSFSQSAVKSLFSNFIEEEKSSGRWSTLSDLWLPFGVIGGQSACLQKIKHSGEAACRTTVPTDIWFRFYCAAHGSAGFHTFGHTQVNPETNDKIFLNSSAFDGTTDGAIGLGGFVAARTGINSYLLDGTDLSDNAQFLSSVQLFGLSGVANHFRFRMHGNGAGFGVYTSNKMIGRWVGVRAGTSVKSILNGSTIGTTTGASDVSVAKDFSMFSGGPGSGTNGQFTSFFIAPGLAESDAVALSSAINNLSQAFGVPVINSEFPVVLIEGDSLSMGSAGVKSVPYSNHLRHKANYRNTRVVNVSRSGAVVSDTVSRHAEMAEVVAAGFSVKSIVLTCIGTNDLGNINETDAATIASLESYWAGIKSDGWNLVAMTIPPRDDTDWNPTKEAYRISVNTAIRASTTPDYVFDLDEYVTTTLGSSPSNTSHYNPDKLHFTNLFYTLLADALAADANIAGLL